MVRVDRRTPVDARRSWYFVEGANDEALRSAVNSRADVLIQELEDFTPPACRAHARAVSPEVIGRWKAAGVVAAARRLGYRAKSAVRAEHAVIINRVLTPSAAEVAGARRLVEAFEAAQAAGQARIEVDGSLVEVPIYLNARRLLDRAAQLGID